MNVFVPIYPASPNGGTKTESWFVKSKREKQEAFLAKISLDSEVRMIPESLRPRLPLQVTLVLRYWGQPRDEDNLIASMKSLRDAVTQWFIGGKPGEFDSDPRLTWKYEQKKVKKKDVGTEIVIEPR